jgi:hypothetical protein
MARFITRTIIPNLEARKAAAAKAKTKMAKAMAGQGLIED